MQVICNDIYVDKQEDIKERIRNSGLKATPARVALLVLLKKEAAPLDVPRIIGNLTVNIDQATVYRSLRSLVEAGLVKQLFIQPGISHYEWAALPHHHHIICKRCGVVEGIETGCEDLKSVTSSFSTVTDHNLEYFGICNKCGR